MWWLYLYIAGIITITETLGRPLDSIITAANEETYKMLRSIRGGYSNSSGQGISSSIPHRVGKHGSHMSKRITEAIHIGQDTLDNGELQLSHSLYPPEHYRNIISKLAVKIPFVMVGKE